MHRHVGRQDLRDDQHGHKKDNRGAPIKWTTCKHCGGVTIKAKLSVTESGATSDTATGYAEVDSETDETMTEFEHLPDCPYARRQDQVANYGYSGAQSGGHSSRTKPIPVPKRHVPQFNPEGITPYKGGAWVDEEEDDRPLPKPHCLFYSKLPPLPRGEAPYRPRSYEERAGVVRHHSPTRSGERGPRATRSGERGPRATRSGERGPRASRSPRSGRYRQATDYAGNAYELFDIIEENPVDNRQVDAAAQANRPRGSFFMRKCLKFRLFFRRFLEWISDW